MIYELRMYSVSPGRLADCEARFRDHVPALFERHGIRCLGTWSAPSGPRSPLFVYLLAYDDLAQREQCLASFYADPQWWRVRELTNAGSELVERYDMIFLRDTAGVSGVDGALGDATRLYEWALHPAAIGQAGAIQSFLNEHYLPALREAGARVCKVCDIVVGCDLPRLALLLSWPDASARQRGWRAVSEQRALQALVRQQSLAPTGALLRRPESYLLDVAR